MDLCLIGENDVTGPGDLDLQGPAGVGSIVLASSPSSSDDGPSSVSRASTGEASAIAHDEWPEGLSAAFADLEASFLKVRCAAADEEAFDLSYVWPG